MTEQEWLKSTEPGQMVDLLSEKKASRRKFRLFSCACCRRIWHLLSEEHSREAVEAAERLADGLATEEECEAICDALDASFGRSPDRQDAERSAALAASFAAFSDIRGNHGNAEGAGYVTLHVSMTLALASGGSPNSEKWRSAEAGAKRFICHLLYDIFSNPFHPVSLDPAWLIWNECTIPKLAQAIYADRAFDRLPVLADALEEAGCQDPDILNHCRKPGEHVRGCWVVDLILGKS